jgi:hypothetical protein
MAKTKAGGRKVMCSNTNGCDCPNSTCKGCYWYRKMEK